MSNIHPFPPKKKQSHKYLIGGPIDSSRVSLRVIGDHVQPHAISELLAAIPDIACEKGDKRILFSSNKMMEERTGKWILHGTDPEFIHLEKQIISLLEKVTDDMSIWRELTENYEVDIHCGVFLEAFNRGLVFSNYLFSELSKRNLKLNFDFYSCGHIDEL